ncbi:hypothetical protein TYRP_006787 [Tyrophagus putrescentiae]|nr:hypothetical protein TYRP_006787 [Tyrophagus putrescentiae]
MAPGGDHRPSSSSSLSLSTPFQAIITPLSVHSPGRGMNSWRPWSAAKACSMPPMNWLAAQPPLTTKRFEKEPELGSFSCRCSKKAYARCSRLISVKEST